MRAGNSSLTVEQRWEFVRQVAGSPQGVITAAERRWHLVSYHPHNGGGAPPWNKDKHGFHTYFDEILCWIHRANN
jgi:hypothetical protein